MVSRKSSMKSPQGRIAIIGERGDKRLAGADDDAGVPGVFIIFQGFRQAEAVSVPLLLAVCTAEPTQVTGESAMQRAFRTRAGALEKATSWQSTVRGEMKVAEV